MVNVNSSDTLVDVKKWYYNIGKTLNIIICLCVFRFKYLDPVDFDYNGGILEVCGIYEELVIIEYKLCGCGQIEIYLPAEVKVKAFLFIVVARWRYADCDEVVI